MFFDRQLLCAAFISAAGAVGSKMWQHLQRGRLHLVERGEGSDAAAGKGFVDFRMFPRLEGLLNATVGQDGSNDSVDLLFLIMGYKSFKIFLILWVPGK